MRTVPLILLACPFCGSRDVFIADISPDDHRDFFAVACTKCEADGPIARTEAEAALAWNTRLDPVPGDGHE